MKHDPADYISAEECAKRMGYKYEYFRDKVSKSPKFPTPIGKNHKVHRLVALAFVPSPDGLPHVNHIDGNKENNSADNLEWVSDRQNKEHAKRCGLLHTVALVAEKHGAGYWFPSIVSVRAAGFTPDGAWDAYSGRCKTHRGYKFFKA